jgi:hypothetical protein
MPKMTEQELRAILAAHRTDSMSAIVASKLAEERATALDYYQGDMSRTMPAAPGRSKAVSTDTSDTIEGLMPALMEIFAGGDEVVRFEPHGPEDVAAAEQETDYVNHVFMQGNPGFLILYSFIKDALLSKVGVVKVWWEREELKERESYLDLDPESFLALIAAEDVEIVEHTMHCDERGVTTHDVTIEVTRDTERARVDTVAPEEWGIARNARRIGEAAYCFHDVFRTESQLIEQGFDHEQVKALPSYLVAHTVEEIARDTVNETTLRQGEDNINTANRLIRVTEHYVRLDYERNDDPRLYRVTTAGEEGHLLLRGGEPDIVEVDRMPFAAMTPVIVTHRFFGRSIADLVRDIQEIKTALLRGMLDNLYLHNNPRVEVAETLTSETTVDDLLVSRPGGIVRVKQPGALAWQTVPDITGAIYPAMQYMDATREWRTGISRQGQGVDPNALQNQVATIANQMFNASQAKVKLIARIFAETGIKDLFTLLHATIRKHATKPHVVRLRNQWAPVDPREWKTRNDMSVNVGLGTGSKAEQLAHLQLIIGAQKEAIQVGMVSPRNLYESAKELSRLAGHKDADRFFMAPPAEAAQQPLPPPSDPRQAEIAAKAAAEKARIESDATHQRMKLQAELTFAQQKFELEKQMRLLDLEIAREKHQHEVARDMTRAIMDGGKADEDGNLQPHPMQQVVHELVEQLRKANAPRRIVRDQAGRPAALEPMTDHPSSCTGEEPAPAKAGGGRAKLGTQIG